MAVGLGCGEYFRFPGRLLELISREGEDSCSSLSSPSYPSSSTGRSGWGLVGSDAASVSWQPELPPTPSGSWGTREICTPVLLWETALRGERATQGGVTSLQLLLHPFSSSSETGLQIECWTVLKINSILLVWPGVPSASLPRTAP